MKFDIIERREAINTILYIADHPNCTRQDVMYENEFNPRARFNRIKDFIDYGLIESKWIRVSPDNQRLVLQLTDAGRELTDYLKKIEAISTLQPQYIEI